MCENPNDWPMEVQLEVARIRKAVGDHPCGTDELPQDRALRLAGYPYDSSGPTTNYGRRQGP